MKLILRSERVLTPEGIKPKEIGTEGGYIVSVEDITGRTGVMDLGCRLVVPGFVDIHSDAIEKELEPRPGTTFPLEQSIIEMDKKLAMAGVTTMFHAIAFETKMEDGIRCPNFSDNMIRTMRRLNDMVLRVDNRIHARFEVSSAESVDVLEKLLNDRLIDLLSVMDHAPGQGQFKDIAKWEKYYAGSYGLSRKEMDVLLAKKLNKNPESTKRLIKLAIENGISVASHDDCNIEKVQSMSELGISISEFPLSLEVASYAKRIGMATGMGAPNIVRGGSQSGNIAAKELVTAGLCDYLCSDYHPISMLTSVYMMNKTLGLPIEQGFQMVTSTPAKIAGLTDRGEIREGKRADIAVIEENYLPSVILTIANGRIVHNMTGVYCHELYKVS